MLSEIKNLMKDDAHRKNYYLSHASITEISVMPVYLRDLKRGNGKRKNVKKQSFFYHFSKKCPRFSHQNA